MPNKLPEWWNSDEIDKIVQSTSPTTNFSPSTSQVDRILQEADGPGFLEKPEDGFKLPKDLSTISKLRKQGYDDKTIIESLQSELAEAEASSTEAVQPKSEGLAGPPEKQAPTFFERLYLPTPRTFVGGGLKQKAGGLLQSAGVVRPRKRKEDVSYFSGRKTIEPEVTIEEAVKKTQENPLFKMGLKLYAQGVEDFQNNPDLQQTDNPFDYNYTDPRFIASAIGEAIPSLLTGVIPATVATIATKNPSVGVATMVATQFGIETGSMMNTALDEGLSPGDASTVAITVGMINGLISTIPAYSLFKKLGFGKKVTNDILVKGIIDRGLYKNISKGALEQGLAEMTEEILQEGVNIIAESTKLGKDISAEEIKDRLAMVSIGGLTVGGTLGGGVKGVQYKSIDKADKIQKEKVQETKRKLTTQTEAKSITEDSANDFNIEYDMESDGRLELSEEEILATGYDIDLNELPVSREDKNGKKYYAVKIKGENDIEGGIRLTSEATRSTILEETVEFRLKKLQSSTDTKDQGLVQKIDLWAKALRKTASEMGLNLRFSDTAEGNLELFSDAMVYHKGGYSDLRQDLAELTYIPDDLANEFIQGFGNMSDGTNVFDLLKGQESNVKTTPGIKSGVDTQLKQEPTLKPPKIVKGKTNQLVPDRNTKTPGFKKWFRGSIMNMTGDPQSTSNPLVLYHGTTEQFEDFMPMTYMTPSPDVANFYARDHRGENKNDPGTEDRGQVYPVYTNLSNPFDFHSNRIDLGEETSYDEFMFEINSKLEEDGKPKITGEEFDAIWDNFASNVEIEGKSVDDAIEENSAFYRFIDLNYTLAEALESRGYDGIKASEMTVSYEDFDEDAKVFIAFNPQSIKSVFNKGTFDINESNISYQLEPDVIKKAVGLYPSVVDDIKNKAKRIKLTLDRRKKNPNIGRQNNNRVEFELTNGGFIVLGRDKTPQDWIKQVESSLSNDEVKKAMNWYEEAYPSFVEEFGEDQAVNYMVAWLLGNVQASPQQALSNTFLGAEQLKAQLPSFKSPGTTMVANNIKSTLQGIQADKGAGAKLYDFLDSALGKSTRTIMQDNPKGLGPVAIDRHTFRDAGFVDGAIRNILSRLAKDKDRVKRLRYDSRGSSPSDTQYEYAIKYMNDLTNELNKMGYMGGDLKPHQVQAIGWTAIARMAESSEGQSIPDAIGLQKPTIAFELEFGTNSSYDTKYGTAFKKLPKVNQIEMTNKIVNKYIPQLAKEFGVKVNSISSEGFGFWGDVDKKKGPSANATMRVRGSDQAIKGLMNSIGILFQQDEVGVLKRGNNLKGLGMRYSHPELSNPDMQEAVYNILREETSNEFTPGAINEVVNGEPSLVVGTFINKDQIQDYSDELASALERIRTELGLELNLTYHGTRYENTTNDWEQDSDGKRYRNQARETHKQSLLDRLDNHYGPKIEASIEGYLKQQARKDRKRTYQLEPDLDAIADLEASKKVQDGQTLDISEETTSAYLKRTLFDKLYPVVSWQKDIEGQFDVRLQDAQNVALAGELYVGKVSEKLKDINKALVDLNNKDSFVRRLTDSGITTEDFNLYLHAKHAQERNNQVAKNNEEFPDGGSGMTTNQARETKKRLNKKYGLKKIRAFENEFRTEVLNKSLDLRLEAGLIDQESYDRLKETYKNYVPLFRVMEDPEAVVDNSTNQSPSITRANAFDVKGPEFRKSRGSSREVKNILVSSIEQLQSAVVRAEKNQVNLKMLNLIESFPSEVFEVKGLKHKPVYNKDGEIDYMTPMEGVKPGEEHVHVKVDGKVKQITFKGEQGKKIAYAMKDMGTSRGIKYLYAFNGYLRYVNTIANPEFMVGNFLRDIQTAGINISAEQSSAVLTTALSPKNLGKAWRGVYKAVSTEDTDNEWGQLYERLRKAGGKTGFFDYQSIEQKLEKLEQSLDKVQNKGIGIKSAGKNIFSFVENLNEATESAVRLTLFKAMLDNGYTEAQSASGAKNVTINFNRKGELGQWLNSLYLFSNASLQGSYRIFGVIKDSKIAQGAVSGLTALGFAEAFMNNMASEGDDEYEKLPNWTKDNNFIMRYGPESDKFFKMRLPYGYNVFKVFGNIAGDIAWRQMQGKPVEYWNQAERALSAVNSSFNPLGSSNILESLSPTVTDPFVQLGTNKDFSGAPIKPKNMYGPYKAEVEMAWKNTPGVYKNLSQGVFKAMGGKIRYNADGSIQDAVRGPLDWMGDVSPEYYEYFVKYLTGGAGKFLVNSVNTIKSTTIDHSTDYENMPFLRQFYQPFSSRSENRILYEYERNMGRKLYTHQEHSKYYNYLASHYEKGNMTRKEYKKRKKKFKEAQKERMRNYSN